MTYFNSCTTLNEVKATYKALAKQYHPDLSGYDTTAIMQAINTEYAFVIAKIARGENLSHEEVEAEILNAAQYKDAINAIINLEGIIIELCGGWIWVSPVVDADFWALWPTMKAAGFFFAKVKRKFYFRSVEYKTSNGKPKTMDQIRTKYGSQLINSSFTQKSIA